MNHSLHNVTLVGWVDDPNGRGTLGILFSCLATLTICVWTALHLNIPGPRDSTAKGWARRTLWMTLGVFCSELVLLAAWRQWAAADFINGQITELQRHNASNGKRECRHLWTVTHGYYAIMGGYCLDLSTEQRRHLGLSQTRYNVTPAGVVLLAQCGRLPDLSQAELKDKSKQDALTKSIVLLQTFWFLVQCIVRKAQGLPLSLLEYHTTAHVVCACMIFGLWWHKLRDVRQPTQITGDWVPGLCAYMFMSSRMSGKMVSGIFVDRHGLHPELLDYKWEGGDQGFRRLSKPQGNGITELRYMFSWLSRSLDPRSIGDPTHVSVHPLLENGPNCPNEEHEVVVVRRALAATRAVQDYPALSCRFGAETGSDSSISKPHIEELLVPFMSDWPDDSLVGRPQGQIMGSIMWFASMLNGAIHMCAWNSSFPSEDEKMLWRKCSGYITSSGLLWFVGNLAAYASNTLALWYRKLEKLQLPVWQTAIIITCEVICGSAYLLARSYLVVASVISLRKMPSAAYQTSSWPDSFPHF